MPRLPSPAARYIYYALASLGTVHSWLLQLWRSVSYTFPEAIQCFAELTGSFLSTGDVGPGCAVRLYGMESYSD